MFCERERKKRSLNENDCLSFDVKAGIVEESMDVKILLSTPLKRKIF